MQEWLVFSDYAPESNLIPTFVIVPFFENFVFVFVFFNYAPEAYLIRGERIIRYSNNIRILF